MTSPQILCEILKDCVKWSVKRYEPFDLQGGKWLGMFTDLKISSIDLPFVYNQKRRRRGKRLL